MKNLKVILLTVILGSAFSLNAGTNLNFANIVGTLTLLKSQSAKISAIDVVGDHEFYLRYSNNRFNYKKIQEEQEAKKTDLPLCPAEKTIKETCK